MRVGHHQTHGPSRAPANDREYHGHPSSSSATACSGSVDGAGDAGTLVAMAAGLCVELAVLASPIVNTHRWLRGSRMSEISASLISSIMCVKRYEDRYAYRYTNRYAHAAISSAVAARVCGAECALSAEMRRLRAARWFLSLLLCASAGCVCCWCCCCCG